MGEISIGNDVQIGPKTVIWGRDHSFSKDMLIREQGYIKAPIMIGDDVWIGANCTILKGVVISKGAVIGAGSVVTRNIPEYAIAAGNPARVIGCRE
jgi:acetyltransferase-like isoleucine patch superfamily enzyme